MDEDQRASTRVMTCRGGNSSRNVAMQLNNIPKVRASDGRVEQDPVRRFGDVLPKFADFALCLYRERDVRRSARECKSSFEKVERCLWIEFCPARLVEIVDALDSQLLSQSLLLGVKSDKVPLLDRILRISESSNLSGVGALLTNTYITDA